MAKTTNIVPLKTRTAAALERRKNAIATKRRIAQAPQGIVDAVGDAAFAATLRAHPETRAANSMPYQFPS